MDNRRLLIAALLSMGILLLWQYLFPPPKPQPRPQPPAAEEPSLATPAPGAVGGPVSAPSAAATAPDSATAPPSAAAAPSEPLEPIAAAEETRVVLENEIVRAEFTNLGAQLVSLVVKGKTGDAGEPLELVQRRSRPPYPFALLDGESRELAANGGLFAAERGTAPAEPAVTFRYRGDLGAAEKRFRLLADGRLDFEIESSTGGFGVLLGPGLRVRTAEELASRFDRRAVVWGSGGEIEEHLPGDLEETRRLAGRAIEWIGLEDTYFLVAVVPTGGIAEARVEPVLLDAGADPSAFDARPLPVGRELGGAEKKLPRSAQVVLVADNGRLSATSYWGSKQYDRLASMPWGLERTVRWGWLGFLARPLLYSLQWIHAHLVANYGWAIVLLTTALKVVLLPLSIASFRSMRKMQKLNPRMQAVREKWRGKLRDKQGRFNPDAQRQMNEEVMALYRAEGVNPAGGCLPILVQLPIFFAFYQLLSTAVELWHSPWAMWVRDLTVPDPYYVLPIVMGVTQVVQQRMTPPPPDPVQKRMLQAMPIVFTIFSLGFPAGLVLYWLTNNVLSIFQQAAYNRFQDRHEPAPAIATARGGGRGGRK